MMTSTAITRDADWMRRMTSSTTTKSVFTHGTSIYEMTECIGLCWCKILKLNNENNMSLVDKFAQIEIYHISWIRDGLI